MKARHDRMAARFSKLNFHDDNLLLLEVHPPEKKASESRIDLHFRDYATRVTKVLSFRGCGNIRYVMDFDVLAANWFAQTKGTTCHTDTSKMRGFVRSQKRDWHVRYMAPMAQDKPIRKKLSSIGSYCRFDVSFYGGSVQILAKSFALTSQDAQRGNS
jgi:hypothetical protein